ncbi:MAG: NAD-dependent epimerase/dehydratase family protein [Phycisphaera sp.]|nr:NAD-dependent epimerase/dehydratase family protein [Phycisphaera sp.]
MKILLTGGSSFTGCHFIRELVRAGHAVTATMRGERGGYVGLRGVRVGLVEEVGDCAWGVSFGDERFVALVEKGGFDVLCHHAADVTDYKSEDFDVHRALENNTRNARKVLDAFKRNGGKAIILTGSVFEAHEGRSTLDPHDPLHAFSPYGLSKTLTSEVFAYHAPRVGLAMGKFVIPNPFGPHEEPRFTTYLARTWLAGKTAAVNTPDTIRDNIHVGLLAKSYSLFVSQCVSQGQLSRLMRCAPSGYAQSQGEFAKRFAAAMRPRLNRPCELDLKKQTDFNEPLSRVNTDALDAAGMGFDEPSAWDALAGYYRQTLG